MLTQDQICDRVHDWCQTQPIKLCVLFGSQATGQVHPASDIDLALWPEARPASQQKLAWWNDLSVQLSADVSLVIVPTWPLDFTEHELDPVLGFEIIKHGRVIYQADPELWFRERSRLWHAFNDSLPFRRAEIAQLKKFAREVLDGS